MVRRANMYVRSVMSKQPIHHPRCQYHWQGGKYLPNLPSRFQYVDNRAPVGARASRIGLAPVFLHRVRSGYAGVQIASASWPTMRRSIDSADEFSIRTMAAHVRDRGKLRYRSNSAPNIAATSTSSVAAAFSGFQVRIDRTVSLEPYVQRTTARASGSIAQYSGTPMST